MSARTPALALPSRSTPPRPFSMTWSPWDPCGAAERAGLRGGSERAYLGNIPIMLGGDLIVAIDGDNVEDQQDLAQIMNAHRAGDSVRVTVYRGRQKLEVTVTLGEAREQV